MVAKSVGQWWHTGTRDAGSARGEPRVRADFLPSLCFNSLIVASVPGRRRAGRQRPPRHRLG